MKMPTSLQAALVACQRIAAERVRLNSLYVDLTAAIDDAARAHAAAGRQLGGAVADGDDAAVIRAREAVQKADLDRIAALEGRRAVSARLIALHASAVEPLKVLVAELESWKVVVLGDAQHELELAVETLASTVRRVLAASDAVGVAPPVARLESLPGIVAPVVLATGWRGDNAATKIYEGLAEPLSVIRGLEGFTYEIKNRRDVERGHPGERPAFAAISHLREWRVLKNFKIDGKEYLPGQSFSSDACNAELLRMLYEQRSLTSPDSYANASATA